MVFELSELESEEAKKFMKEHYSSCNQPTTIGGLFSYIITPTSIGYSISVRCNVCGETLDVTDYGSW